MIPYIINVALILAGCLAFYKILLNKETFYRINRYVLVLCLFISFGLPLLPVPQKWSFRKAETTEVVQKQTNYVSTPVNTLQPKTILESAPAEKNTPVVSKTSNKISFSQVMTWIVYLYWFGVAAFAINFLIQIVVLLYRAYTRPVIKDGRFRIIEMRGDHAPCSFGNNIFINPEKYDWDTYEQIILHEKIHIQQRHTLDIVLAEMVLIFQWFNPFAWQYRREIENNLEFLTDDQLVRREEVEKTTYQMSLLKVSAPHFPLSLTTNYNQSLLKKRIAMMNSKKSNVHTAWKYFFLLPVLVLFACLFNEPFVHSQTTPAKSKKEHRMGMDTEGAWFATIKNDKIQFQFKSDDDEHSFNSSSFEVKDFPNLPQGTSGTFKVTREAGTMEFTGKFEGNQGMGRYKFVQDNQYKADISKMVSDPLDNDDMMVFFFINVKRSYVDMLKSEGYPMPDKDELIPLVAIGVDQAYIRSIKDAGFKDVSLEDLIPLKSLDIDKEYIQEIRSAGYTKVTADKLITFKSQGIDKKYIENYRSSMKNEKNENHNNDHDDEADNIVAMKAMNVDKEYITSIKQTGLSDVSSDQLVALKSLGVTPEFIKQFQSAGYKSLNVDNIIAMKAQSINPEYLKSFESLGFKNLDLDDAIAMKSMGVTAEYIKTFTSLGYQVKAEDIVALKSQNITPEFLKSFESVGFKNIDLEEAVSLKATGVDADYIKKMKDKGFNYTKIEKYITLKTLTED